MQLSPVAYSVPYDNTTSGLTAKSVQAAIDELSISSGGVTVTSVTTSPYNVLTTDQNLLVDTSSAKTLNLPAATTVLYIHLKDIIGTAHTYNITLVPNGTDKIEGLAANKILSADYGWWTLLSDGVGNWWVG